ncbi:DUF724 domain-containing protein 3 isoform X1 [Cannabis sativa]|uniref:DUF724 domain-containing protein 3 isoform X1 n=2 Tax=Cannabis sativa TaxID=3483 RepID=UPI0029C9BF51|nr:DUF724 domain-containing protein 3 isoform X1 [Cannabis sativa]XP_060957995.1 DUF724 domain-containing protein 3 isoform X1 [Cannabis sativa]
MLSLSSFDSNDPRQLFSEGTEVEVSSDEEGFRGAWFKAFVVENLGSSAAPKKRRKVLVEYWSLVTEDGFQPLREHVDLYHLRPLPPDAGSQDFEVGDVVDADYRDGWWTGVVKKVLGFDRYRVFFENPPDLIEFERKHMRFHQDWVNGKWVRPKKEQKMTGSTFSSGTDVEVHFDNEDLSDAWIPAIVIKENDDNTFLVKYHNSKAKNWKDTVDFTHIRPAVPRHVDRAYNLYEKVDAFFDYSWRVGEITKILPGKRYTVSFKHGMKSKEFSQTELRPFVEWKDGKWHVWTKEGLVDLNLDFQENLEHGAHRVSNADVVSQLGSLGLLDCTDEEYSPQPTNSGKNLRKRSTDYSEESVSTTSVSSPNNGGSMHQEKGSPSYDKSYKARKYKLATTPASAREQVVANTRLRKPVVPFIVESNAKRSKQHKGGGCEIKISDNVQRRGRTKKSVKRTTIPVVGKTRNVSSGAPEKVVEKEGMKGETEADIALSKTKNTSTGAVEIVVKKEGIKVESELPSASGKAKKIEGPSTAEKAIEKEGTSVKVVGKEGTSVKAVGKEGTSVKVEVVGKEGTAEKAVEKQVTAEKAVEKQGAAKKEVAAEKQGAAKKEVAVEKAVEKQVAAKKEVAAEKAVEKQVAAEKAVEKEVAGVKAVVKEVVAAKAVVKEVAAVKAVEKEVAVGKPAEKDVAAGKAFEKVVAIGKAVVKEITAGKAVEKEVAAEKAVEKEVAAGKAVEKEVAAGKAVEKEVAVGKAVEKEVATGKAVEEAVAAGKAVEKAVTAGKAVEKAVAAEKEVTAVKAVEKEVTTEKAVEKEVAAEKAVEQQVAAEKAVEKQVAAEKAVEEGIRKEAEGPIASSSAEGAQGSVAKGPVQFLDQELVNPPSDSKNNSDNLSDDNSAEFKQNASEGCNNKRKRGRPRKVASLGQETSAEDGHDEEYTVKACKTNGGVFLPTQGGKETTDLQDTSTGKNVHVSGMNCSTNEAESESIYGRVSSGTDDDDNQPLSKWFGGIQSQPGVQETRSLGRAVFDPRTRDRERATIGKKAIVVHAFSGSEPEDNLRLPFVKSSPVWKAIDDMDIFGKMKQVPHFRPLYKCKEEHREGMAIGHMVTFAGLVDRISRMQVDDRVTSFHSTLETLQELEKHGFDISVLRNRASTLLSIKDRQARARHDSKEAERKINEQSGEKVKLVEEIDDVTRKINELQAKLAILNSQKENKEQDIRKLQQFMDDKNQNVLLERQEFEKLAATPICPELAELN